EAVNLALRQLGANRAEVDIVVLSEGRSGIFGIGAEDARVRVTRLAPPVVVASLPASTEPEAVTQAREIIERLLDAMHLDAEVMPTEPPPHGVPPGVEPLAFDIQGEDLGVLIGRRGQTLAALQYLVNLMASRVLPEKSFVVLDVEGYRRRRYDTLHALAQRMAERVRATGQSITLEPMPPAERRIVHVALHDHPDVTTQSIGEGESRKVAIIPRRR
ncbi:MAG: protein jag, partial [Chloroflexi bacterium]|nr:protein jag [Chloroflexota bacterium]